MAGDELRETIADICRTGHHKIAETKVVDALAAYTTNKIIEAIDEYKLKNFPHTKTSLAQYLGVSRVTLDAWIKEPEKITISTVKKLLELEVALKYRKER